ncbi:zinc ribbon domain-containing protein [Roseicyclus persicicus]|uniref:Zinc ribbon domain-containing protein n=1 Tax=Roseicyclus persicicus TaxID=2650661 RepID=A0A7X6GZ78_9RHOB|nr:zinc ribbon domain-containing protein [Roseibacterium persicicum]NKX43946.1 zinc ribbon domain-containing protein [Roseibacterium persicicum]
MSDTDTRTAPARPEDEHRFPCDQCGADMRFDPARNLLLCDHCGHEAALEPADGPWGGEAAALVELDYETAIAAKLPAQEMEETRVSQCPNCGAQVEFQPDIHAKECPFCATPVVTDTGTHRHIKPKGVIPFKLTEREAHAAMTRWLGRLWFAPNGLQDYARNGRKLDGIYVPYWTYDADTATRYHGQRGDAYYVTVRGSDGKSRQERRIRWTRVSGGVSRWFDDILILASRSLPKSFTDRLAPWDLSALDGYRPEFLSGFRAEGYQVQLDEGFEEAKQVIEAQIRQDIRRDIGGDEQRIDQMQVRIDDVTFKHILLPVWLAAYKYRGKSYRFVVNGQTGKVQGERPWSWVKITLAVIAAAILAGAALYGYALLEDGGTSFK